MYWIGCSEVKTYFCTQPFTPLANLWANLKANGCKMHTNTFHMSACFLKVNFQSAIWIPFLVLLSCVSYCTRWLQWTVLGFWIFNSYTYFQSMFVYDHQKCSNSLLKCESPIRNSLFSPYNFATKIQLGNIFIDLCQFFLHLFLFLQPR